MSSGHSLRLRKWESANKRGIGRFSRTEAGSGEGNLDRRHQSMWVDLSIRTIAQRVVGKVKADLTLGSIPNVYPLYAQGRTLLSIGVLPGYDLTHEAAFAKLLWLVSRKDLTFRQRQELFEVPVAGEMSV